VIDKDSTVGRGVTLLELLDFGPNHAQPAVRWTGIVRSTAFGDFSNSPAHSYLFLFSSNFPESAALKLSNEITRLRVARSLYFSTNSASPTLIVMCEVFLLLSAAPTSFLVAFESLELIPLLTQVLDIDRSRPAELVLQMFSNCTQSSSDLARLLFLNSFDRICNCFNPSSLSLKQHLLFCLSCLCDRINPEGFADLLFPALAGAIQSPQFFEIGFCGLSLLSFHRPDLIVADGLVVTASRSDDGLQERLRLPEPAQGVMSCSWKGM
jgi:hypothetical protein